MKLCCGRILRITVISLSILFLKHGANPSQITFQEAVYKDVNSIVTCRGQFMSFYISKEQFPNLPFTIYVQDEQGTDYPAMAIAHQCHYFIGEARNFFILVVSHHSCFVRRQKYTAHFTVVIKIITEEGRGEMTKQIPLICKLDLKEQKKKKIQHVEHKTASKQRSEHCNNDGFNIIIYQNVTVPPLNLDTVWIPSDQSCKAKTRSLNAVTFNFPFIHCGTQYMVAGGIITYWVNIEAQRLSHYKKGSIFRDTPFRLTVRCSFELARVSHLGMEVQGQKQLPPLKNEGKLTIEMRFAKDSSYRSFYSSRDPPVVRELGQPVYVDVFALKGQDKELVLLLHDCWATPTINANDLQRWNLLIKGCPYDGDSHKTVLLPVTSSEVVRYPSLHKWFVVQLFSFVKTSGVRGEVYFHCDTEICKGTNCSRPCSGRSKRLEGMMERKQDLDNIISGGPIFLLV